MDTDIAGATAPSPDVFADDLRRLAEALTAQRRWRAPELRPVRLDCSTERVTDVDAVRQRLGRWLAEPGAVGWCETPQRLVDLHAATDLPAGVPLHAEVAAGPRSLHVRRADDAWLLTTFEEADVGAAAGAPAWARDEPRVHAGDPRRRWHYRVYFRLQDDGVLAAWHARLAGLETA